MRAEGISKSFGERELFSDLSFEIERGIVLVEGPSGCGKTTLLRILSGLETPDSGSVDPRGKISYAGQDDSLLPELSLIGNMRSLLGENRFDSVHDLSDKLGFTGRENDPVRALSGGERQKAEILFALSRRTETYIFDEPFASIDRDSRQVLVGVFNDLSRFHAVIIVNHDIQIQGLDVSVNIQFTSSGIEIKSYQSEGKLSTDVSTDDTPSDSLGSGVRIVFSSCFRNNRGLNILRGFLLLCCTVLFAFGCGFTNTKSYAELLTVSFSQEPFSEHLFRNDSGGVLSSLSLELIQDDACPVISVIDSGYRPLKIVGCLDEDDDRFVVYDASSDSDLLGPIIPDELEEVSIVSGDETVTYAAEVTEDTDYLESLLPDNMDFLYATLYTQRAIAAVPSSFVWNLLCSGGGNVYFDGVSWGFDCYVGFAADGEGGVIQSFGEGVIRDTFEPVLAVPGIEAGQTVVIRDSTGYGIIEMETTETTDGNDVVMSLGTLVSITSAKQTEGGSSDSVYISLYLPNEDLLEMAEHDDIYVLGIINDYTKGNDYQIYFFSFSAIALVAYALLSLLSRKGLESWERSLKSVIGHLGYGEREYRIGTLLYSLASMAIPLVIAAVLAPTGAVALGNYACMVDRYSYTRPAGFYYYSQEPDNAFYDAITSPLKFISPEYVTFALIGIALIALLVDVIYWRSTDGKKRNKGGSDSSKR